MSLSQPNAGRPDPKEPWLEHPLYKELVTEKAKALFVLWYKWSQSETDKNTYGPTKAKVSEPPPNNVYAIKHAEVKYEKPSEAVYFPAGCLYTYHDGQKWDGAVRAKASKAEATVIEVLGTKPPKNAGADMEVLLQEIKDAIKKVANGKILVELRELVQQIGVTLKGKLCTTKLELTKAWGDELTIELVDKMYKLFYYEWNCDKGRRFIKLQYQVMKDLGIWHNHRRDSIPTHSTILSVVKEHFQDSWRKFLFKASHGVSLKWSGNNKTSQVDWKVNVKNWGGPKYRVWMQKKKQSKVNHITV